METKPIYKHVVILVIQFSNFLSQIKRRGNKTLFGNLCGSSLMLYPPLVEISLRQLYLYKTANLYSTVSWPFPKGGPFNTDCIYVFLQHLRCNILLHGQLVKCARQVVILHELVAVQFVTGLNSRCFGFLFLL